MHLTLTLPAHGMLRHHVEACGRSQQLRLCSDRILLKASRLMIAASCTGSRFSLKAGYLGCTPLRHTGMQRMGRPPSRWPCRLHFDLCCWAWMPCSLLNPEEANFPIKQHADLYEVVHSMTGWTHEHKDKHGLATCSGWALQRRGGANLDLPPSYEQRRACEMGAAVGTTAGDACRQPTRRCTAWQ